MEDAGSSSGTRGDHVVLYDGECPFCRFSMALLLAWDRDGRLRPITLQDPRAHEWVGDLPEHERMGSWHVVPPDGMRRSAGLAFAPLLRALPRGDRLAPLTERFPRAVDGAYHWVSAHKDTFARLIPAPGRRWADGRIAARSGERRAETVGAGPRLGS